MADLKVLLDLISQLSENASPRPDLVTPGSTGALENARPYTFAGRVATRREDPRQLLARFPTESPDEGFSLPQLLPMAAGIVKPAKTAQESAIQALMKKYPGLWEKAVKDSRTLRTQAKEHLPFSFNTEALGSFNALTNRISIHPKVLTREIEPPYPMRPAEVAAHELLHFLNRGRVATTSPSHALESAEQIGALMKGTGPESFIQDYINQAKRLQQSAEARLFKLLPVPRKVRDFYEGAGSRRAYDEALSYLGEEALRPESDPLIKSIAQALGLQ